MLSKVTVSIDAHALSLCGSSFARQWQIEKSINKFMAKQIMFEAINECSIAFPYLLRSIRRFIVIGCVRVILGAKSVGL